MRLLNLYICFFLLFAAQAAVAKKSVVQLSGVVTAANRQPVEYASVRLKNTRYGDLADDKGAYRLSAPAGEYVLVVSAVGYRTVEQPLSLRGEQALSVAMKPDEKDLDEVVVVGKTSVRQVNESAFNVVAIDAKPLHNTSMSLTHALDRVSGVKIRETGGVGSRTQISLNGFSGRHIKVFMDGIPMEGMGSSFQLNNIPVNLADRIEVYKGVVPIELGADALGGAINIVTRRQRSTYVDASYAYGSFNTHKSNLSVGHTTKSGLFFQINAYQNYSDNSYRIKTKLLDLNTNSYSPDERWFRRFHDSYRNEALAARVGVVRKPWADRLTLGVTLSHEKADIQNANLMQIVYGGRERSAGSVIPSLSYEKRNLMTPNLNLLLTATYSRSRNSSTDTLPRQYSWSGEYREKRSKGEGQYSMSEYDNETFYATANLRYRIASRHSFTLNNLLSDYSRKATDAAANAENSTAATFMRRTNVKNIAGLSYRFSPSGRWNASAFAKRYDVLVRGPVNVSTTTTAAYEEQEKPFSTTGYGVTATCYLPASLQLKASLEKSYRLPSENELFGDESLETGDASLKPENSYNLNINISSNQTLGRAHAVYFDLGLIYRDTRDYIRRQIEQRYGGAYYTNHGKVRNLGFDVEARYFYGRAFSAGGNFTFQDIRNMERYAVGGRELIYYKDRMPNVPYLFGNVDASYHLNGLFAAGNVLSVGYNMRYIHAFFRSWESEGGNVVIPGQLSHDVTLTFSLRNGRYHIATEVRNLTDELLYDNYSLQKPGRSFLIKLRYFFFKQ